MNNLDDIKIKELEEKLKEIGDDNSFGAKVAKKKIEDELILLKATKESEKFFK